MTADLRHTQGGLVTDVAAHVLTEDNEVIQGLYAAGGVTEGFSTRAGCGLYVRQRLAAGAGLWQDRR